MIVKSTKKYFKAKIREEKNKISSIKLYINIQSWYDKDSITRAILLQWTMIELFFFLYSKKSNIEKRFI